jgi:hypothetical protein
VRGAARLAREIGVPVPTEDYGRATLDALEALLRACDPFPTAYRAAWEDVGRHVLDDVREEQRDGAARCDAHGDRRVPARVGPALQWARNGFRQVWEDDGTFRHGTSSATSFLIGFRQVSAQG